MMAETKTKCLILLLLATLLAFRHASSEVSGPECCDPWTKDGWKRFRELPSRPVERHKPTECANAVAAFSAMPGMRPAPRTSPRTSTTSRPRVVAIRVRRAAHGELGPGQQARLTWTPGPGGARGHLGVSLCRDHEQTQCLMLDAVGVQAGRVGYSWRRHGGDEPSPPRGPPSLLSWVPGRVDHVPETVIQSEQRLEDGLWPNGGAQEIQVNLERTNTLGLRVWVTGAERDALDFPLPEDVPYFAVTPFAPLGQINTATAAMAASQKAKLYSDAALNPLLMRGENLLQRPGNRIIVSWRPDDPAARLGFAMCRDARQDYCHVLLLFGFNGHLGYAYKRHSPQEAQGSQGQAEPGWVAGRRDRVPGTVLRSDPSVQGWPQGGLGLVVDRTIPGNVQVWIEGGETLSFAVPDFYTHFTVSSLDDRGVPSIVTDFSASPAAPASPPAPTSPPAPRPPAQTTTKRPAAPRPTRPPPPPPPRPTTPRPSPPKTPRPQTPRPAPAPRPPPPPPPPQQQQQPESGGVVLGDNVCVAAIRTQMVRGQQMLIKWEPSAQSGNLGVSFCVDRSQGDCYVLDTFAFRDRRLGYSWRHHSALEAGGGAWVPGRDTLLPETHLQTEAEVEPGWTGSASKYLMMVTLTPTGMVELRVDGLDPAQRRQLVFALPEAYTTVAVSSAQNTGDYSIGGPCFNGLKYKFAATLCSLPDVSGLAVDNVEMGAAWTLKARSARGQMRSPAMSGLDGDLCVSIEALALGSARLTITVESLDGTAQPVKLVEILPLPQESSGRAEWQRLQKTVSLPDAMRRGQVRLVVSADQVDGRGLVLVKRIAFCNPNTCGVARQNVLPLIAYGHVAKVGDYPWYAGIYRQDADEWVSVCGGTLVRADIVVSAAHCFYDESSWKLKDRNKFKVSVGKYVRDWEVQEPGEQRSAVLNMVIPERYRGSKRIYEHDIAFLRVRFVVSTLVLPICVDFTGQFGLRPGDVGVVTGWGKTETEMPSTKLQYARMPYVPFDQCIRSVPDTLAKYVTGDKFCAGNLNGSTVWPGDSGGGLAFLRSGRWFLRGVVSTGIPGRLTYSAFTDVNFYLDLLNEFFS